MNRWRAIVFDLDDTLYLERDYVMSGFRAVAAWAEPHLKIPREQGFDELKKLFEQGARGTTFDQWLSAHDLFDPGLVQRLVALYREHEPSIAPFDGVAPLLRSLHETCCLGLLTDGLVAVQQRKLAALGLAEHFDVVVFSDEWGRGAWKPSPIPFNIVLERLQASGREVVYVGDNPQKDFIGARRVGMTTVRVRHPEGLYAQMEPLSPDHAPDLEITHVAALKEICAPCPSARAKQEPAAPRSVMCCDEAS